MYALSLFVYVSMCVRGEAHLVGHSGGLEGELHDPRVTLVRVAPFRVLGRWYGIGRRIGRNVL